MLTRFTLAAVLAARAPCRERPLPSPPAPTTRPMPPFGASTGPAEDAFRAANDVMHAGMDIAYSGDADIDFARGMIAHHEGAVAMARIVLEHTATTPRSGRLAKAIIAAQEAEIAWMRDWLAGRGDGIATIRETGFPCDILALPEPQVRR
jgi:hypothetical protein